MVQPVAGDAAGVVVGPAVGKAVWHDEIHDLILEWIGHRRLSDGSQIVGRCTRHGDGRHIGRQVKGKGGLVARSDAERNVVGAAVLTVALAPCFVDGNFELIRAGRQPVDKQRRDAVTVGVLQPGKQAVRLPVAGTAVGGLVVAGCGGNSAVMIVGDPVGLVVVVELDRGWPTSVTARYSGRSVLRWHRNFRPSCHSVPPCTPNCRREVLLLMSRDRSRRCRRTRWSRTRAANHSSSPVHFAGCRPLRHRTGPAYDRRAHQADAGRGESTAPSNETTSASAISPLSR